MPRRALLATVLGTAVLPSASCGIRLEDGAPRLPLVPTRTPVPAEAELVALTRDTAALAEQAGALGGDLGAALAALHRRQHTVLRTTLARRQVPLTALDAGGRTASGTTSAATPSARPSVSPTAQRRAALAADEGAAAASAGDLADVDTDLRATVAALHAQRYAAAALLAGRPPRVPLDPVAVAPVAELAQETAAAVWLLEVVSARSTGSQRARADTSLQALRALLADQLAGGARPEQALGHPRPVEVSTPADAARLAREVHAALRAGYGPHLEPVVTQGGAEGLAAVTRWLGTVEVEAHRWGLDLLPFPGLE